jgi:redox-sensitive bicupin YhaK (pirin superfamily)
MQHDPKILIHTADSRGGGEHGWLKTRHSFSFAHWFDPDRMGFGALRVLNDDLIMPESGFGTHGHDNMEIITVVNTGEITHRDSMGSEGRISAGEVQVMSAGSGVLHSEYNEGPEVLTLFQIWITPNARNVAPRYDERTFSGEAALGETLLVAPMDSGKDALLIHQDAYISRTILDAEHPLRYTLKDPTHGVYLFVVDGSIETYGHQLFARDALGIESVSEIPLTAQERASMLVIEVPMISD